VWTQLGDELVKPFGRIEWAGTETAAEWNGYMDGAISSGYLAADRVLTKASTTASIA
jgi:monoamine oxidase